MYPNSSIMSDADFLYFHHSLSTIQKESQWFHQLNTLVYRCDQSEIMTNEQHKKAQLYNCRQKNQACAHLLYLDWRQLLFCKNNFPAMGK